MPSPRNVNHIGKPAAVLSGVFAIVYSVFQLLAVFKIIPHPRELFWLFLPSLLLSYAFLITIICLHFLVKEERKIYTAIASAFALLYCAFVSLVYFTQLAVVLPLLTQNKVDETYVLAFTEKSFMVAVDCIGYATMSAATLFAAFAFYGNTQNKWLHRSLLYNGLLTPFVILAFFMPAFLFVGALWMITLPLAMINTAQFFANRSYQTSTKAPYERAVLQ